MAYNYLGLVNDLCNHFNEVPLTSSNFATANKGFYGDVKKGVNNALRRINQDAFQWPFNYVVKEETLTAGDNRYSYPADAKWVDFNTFRIKRDNTIGNKTQFLDEGDYEDYLYRYLDDEYNTTNTGIRSLPKRIYRAPGQEYTLHPVPDEAYTLVYEYYSLQPDLSAYDDIPTLPYQFSNVLFDGGCIYGYKFRSDHENAKDSEMKFERGIADMRKIYVNRYEKVRDTRTRGYASNTTLRTG